MDTAQNHALLSASKWCIFILAFLLPIWFLPYTNSPVDFNKALMVSLFVFLALLFYLAHAVKSGRIEFPLSIVFILGVLLLLAWLTSALVANSPQSLWGFGAETTSFFSFVVFLLLSFVVALVFSEKADLAKLLFLLFLGLAAMILWMWVFSIFGLGRVFGGVLSIRSFNPIGSWYSVALAAGFFALLIQPYLSRASGFLKLALWALFVAALALMVLVNFFLAWVTLAFFSLVLLAYAIWRRSASPSGIGVPIFLLVLSLFGAFYGDVVSGVLPFTPPVEVGVSHRTTFLIAAEALKENLLFGSGPASFTYLWDKFKPFDVNNTIFWNIRFNVGSSYVLSLLAEVGLAAWLLFIAFLAMILYLVFRVIAAVSNDNDDATSEALTPSILFLVSYMILVWFLYAGNYTLIALGFLMIGVALAYLKISGAFKLVEISLLGEGPKGFVSAIAAVLLLILVVGGIYAGVSKYIAQVAYARGLDAVSRQNLDAAERDFGLALRLDGRNDFYLKALSRVHFSRAQLLLRGGSATPELLGSNFKDALDRAINASQAAISANPRDYENLRALGKIYEFLVGLNVAGSLEAAVSQYDAAITRAPQNPLLWRDKALTYLADFSASRGQKRENLGMAREALLKSVELKADYTEGHFLLAQVYDAEGETGEAIKRGEAAALLAPNDIGTLFQLGILYYRNNRLQDAQIVLERAVAINNNYSNARYFLGLIYDRQNQKEKAIGEFEKIAALNPANEEVIRILGNLRAGRAALSGIAPPGAAPEKRNEPPVRENGGGR